MYVELHLDKHIAKQLSTTFFKKEDADNILAELLTIAQGINRVIPFSFSIYHQADKKSPFWNRSAGIYEIGENNIIKNFDYYFREDVKKYTDDVQEQNKILDYFNNNQEEESTEDIIVPSKKNKFKSLLQKNKQTSDRKEPEKVIDSTVNLSSIEEVPKNSSSGFQLLKDKKVKFFLVVTAALIGVICLFHFIASDTQPKQSDETNVLTSINRSQTEIGTLIQRVIDKQENGTTVEVTQKDKVVVSVEKDGKGNTKINFKE